MVLFLAWRASHCAYKAVKTVRKLPPEEKQRLKDLVELIGILSTDIWKVRDLHSKEEKLEALRKAVEDLEKEEMFVKLFILAKEVYAMNNSSLQREKKKKQRSQRKH